MTSNSPARPDSTPGSPATPGSDATSATPAKSTAAAAPRSPAPPRTNGAGLASLTAFAALLVAAAAIGVAVHALDVAREAKSRAVIAEAAQARPTASPGPTGSAVPSPTVTRSATAAPSPTFLAEFVAAQLQIPPSQGCASIYVDVDTLQVGIFDGHEFYLSSCFGPQAIRIDAAAAAAPAAATPTPEACAALLAAPGTEQELALQVRVGLVFCLLTSPQDAAKKGLPQRLGIVEVRSVATDGTVTAAISTYRVPTLSA